MSAVPTLAAREGEDRASLERRLLRAEHLAALNTLLAGIAHNLGNPLTTIGSFLDLVPERWETDEEFRTRFYELVLGEFGRVRELVETMTRAAVAAETQESSVWSGEELIHEVAAYVAPAAQVRSIEVRVRIAGKLPALEVPREVAKQIILVLVDNAIAFSPESGEVTLDAETCNEEGLEKLSLTVRDGGCGVVVEDRERIFEPFYTTRSGGMGVGLFVARCLARAHGGSIEVGEAAPSGAAFSLVLPSP